MKRIVIAGVVILFVVVGLGYAQNRGTAAEAKAMLDKAVAFYKAYGPEKAFAAFNDRKGPFVDRDLYVFALDLNGKILAHGAKTQLIGKSMKEKNFIAEMLAVAKSKGAGTVDYRWENPRYVESFVVVEDKTAYIEKVGGVVLGCGYYKGDRWQPEH